MYQEARGWEDRRGYILVGGKPYLTDTQKIRNFSTLTQVSYVSSVIVKISN